ncbi:hypothetical protein RMATCC62417_18458 [Rhizopus microsporus]|nr:hypothetical protein RMATCC62417_18458 [Rhizopus microsporus]
MAVLAMKVEKSNIARTESTIAEESQLASENDDKDDAEEEELITDSTADLTKKRITLFKICSEEPTSR